MIVVAPLGAIPGGSGNVHARPEARIPLAPREGGEPVEVKDALDAVHLQRLGQPSLVLLLTN